MTNKDFWESIDSIIREGFSPDGLKTLEIYANKFIAGQLVYQRFSSFEQYGCSNGGALNVIASLLAGAEIATDKLTAPEGSFKREQQRAEAQIGLMPAMIFISVICTMKMFLSQQRIISM